MLNFLINLEYGPKLSKKCPSEMNKMAVRSLAHLSSHMKKDIGLIDISSLSGRQTSLRLQHMLH